MLLTLLFLGASSLLKAGDIRTQALEMNRKDNVLKVSFMALIPEDAVRSTSRLVITPQLYNGEGESISLQPFTVTGHRRARRDKQQRLLARKGSTPANYTLCGSTLAYSDTTTYAAWMDENLSLRFSIEEEACCDVKPMPEKVVATDLPLHFEKKPMLASVTPQVSEVSQKAATKYPFLRMLGKEATSGRGVSIRFRVVENEIDSAYSTNRDNLKDILDAITLVQKDTRTRLEKISVTGYASPEGNKEQNKRLSLMRALALKDYIAHKMNVGDEKFEVTAGGEDWQGLKELVQKSDMPYKDEITAIIEQAPEKERNARMKRLAGGRPYKSMLDVLFPQLRDACYLNVWYSEKPDSNADTINAAMKDIAEGHYDEALRRLETVENDSRSWNATGVCHLLKGDTKEARRWFTRAWETGDKEAAENLKRLK